MYKIKFRNKIIYLQKKYCSTKLANNYYYLSRNTALTMPAFMSKMSCLVFASTDLVSKHDLVCELHLKHSNGSYNPEYNSPLAHNVINTSQ